jgi:hypothetical protein
MRSGTSPLTAQECGNPVSDQWFTGVGAGPKHDSVIELVNPDAGRADVDVTLYGQRAFTRRALHGITIPAHRAVRLDLGRIAPRRQLLSARVQVTRGRLAVHVWDSRTDLVSHQVVREWLPGQTAPALESQLLGLPTGQGTRTLQVANPGEGVVRAQVKIVTGDTSFTPAGLKAVTVQPGSTTSVPLTKVLAQALRDGAVGVQVIADAPVVASVLTVLGKDEAVTAPDTAIRGETATVLPVASGRGAVPVRATVYLSADAAGAATVKAYDASGRRLLRRRVGQQQGRVVAVTLPTGAAFLRVIPERTVIRAAVVLTGDGASVVPLHELLTEGLVPHVQPGPD